MSVIRENMLMLCHASVLITIDRLMLLALRLVETPPMRVYCPIRRCFNTLPDPFIRNRANYFKTVND